MSILVILFNSLYASFKEFLDSLKCEKEMEE